MKCMIIWLFDSRYCGISCQLWWIIAHSHHFVKIASYVCTNCPALHQMWWLLTFIVFEFVCPACRMNSSPSSGSVSPFSLTQDKSHNQISNSVSHWILFKHPTTPTWPVVTFCCRESKSKLWTLATWVTCFDWRETSFSEEVTISFVSLFSAEKS